MINTTKFFCFMSFGLFFSAMSFAQAQSADSLTRGKQVYEQKCITCHGADGLGVEAEQGPKLAGQHSWYLEKQLQNFLSGERKNPKMMDSIKTLSSQEVTDVSAYIAAMTAAK